MVKVKPTALLNFTKGSDDKIKNLGQKVLKSLSKNSYFPNPTISMEVFGKNVTDYVASIPERQLANSDNSAIKNGFKAIVIANLTILRAYVNAIAMNDRIMLLTSGFDITPETKPKPASNSVPTNIVAKPGEFRGSAQLSCARQVSAVTYEVRAKTADGLWSEIASSTKSQKVIIKDLIPATLYEFQMRTVGVEKSSEWSNGIYMVVV
jgi:hypothetical protein